MLSLILRFHKIFQLGQTNKGKVCIFVHHNYSPVLDSKNSNIITLFSKINKKNYTLQMYLLVVVQSKHSVVVAATKKCLRSKVNSNPTFHELFYFYQNTYARHTYTGSNLQVHQIHQFSKNNFFCEAQNSDSFCHSFFLINQ